MGLPIAKINDRYGDFWRIKLSTKKIKGLISQSSRWERNLIFYIADKTLSDSFSPPIVLWSAKISLTPANLVNCRIDLMHRWIFPWKVLSPAFTQWYAVYLSLSSCQHVINSVSQSSYGCLSAAKRLVVWYKLYKINSCNNRCIYIGFINENKIFLSTKLIY